MTFEKLQAAVEGKLLCHFSSIAGFETVAVDSRSVQPGSLFIPLRGLQQDGHRYIPQALEKGAVCIFADTVYSASESNRRALVELCKAYRAVCIVVDHTLTALQAAAAAYLCGFPDLLKIGVTGSNGKTTTKELLGSVFSQKYCTIINEGNLNSETGLPLSVFTVRQEHEVGIFELGMNRSGEISELAALLRPNGAVITNIGTAHIGMLGSKDAIAAEKKAIFTFFDETSVGFVPDTDEYAAYLKDVPHGTMIGYGMNEQYVLHGIFGSDIIYKNKVIHFPLPGIHNVHNAFAAIAVAEHFGLSVPMIKAGLEQIHSLFGRSQVIKTDAITYLLDCYNANPDSMQAGMRFCDDLTVTSRKIYIIGAMKELGDAADTAHAALYAAGLSSDASILFFFGDEFESIHTAIPHNTQKTVYWHREADSELLAAELDSLLQKNDFVFLKGSRSLALERFEPVLKKERV